MIRPSSKFLRLPILILFIWLGFTLFLFFCGPYEYKLKKATYFILYLILVHGALYLGYKKGLKTDGKKILLSFSSIKFTKWCILLTVLYTSINLIYTNGANIVKLDEALINPADAYEYSHDDRNISIFNYASLFFAPISTLALSCGIFFWKQLSLKFRYLLVSFIIFTILSSVSGGVRSGIVGTIIYLTSAILLLILHNKIHMKLKNKIFISVSILTCFFMLMSYTNNITENRGGFVLVNPLTNEEPDHNNVLYKIFPEKFELTISAICFYFSHPYFRLNEAMDLPSNGIGFGLSNSYFIVKNVERLTGWNGLEDISYALRLDRKTANGIFGVYWSTFYTWIASDFTFPGTILVIYLIGYLLAVSLKDTFISSNPFAIATFCNLFLVIYSFPTLNPLQDGNGITSILGLMFIWHLTRRVKFKTGNGTTS
jgi:hypothetical protein